MLNTPSTVANARITTVHDAENCSDYLLVCEATASSLSEGTWRFSLESADGQPVFDAGDTDLGDLNRLTLLAAVRGLESIDGPSSVTLLSHNRYLVRSLSDSLPRWRANNFVWEHFGRRIDVQHADLWRRVDRALCIHRVEACLVSSRLVSVGASPGTTPAEENPNFANIRVDSPHRGPGAPRGGNGPTDQLRRWLLRGNAADGPQESRRRFTAKDLIESR
ncbi:MAG: ribonuclease HI [Planctomycetaceae bacterium]|nr:ribonuclease HI [Planctomycetaceae bacterium]